MNLIVKSLLTAVALTAATFSASAQDAQALLNSKACLACHNVEAKVIGPAYKEIAAKYASDAKAVDLLVASIKGGSTGKWGSIPMPPNPVTDDEAKTLANWILSLK